MLYCDREAIIKMKLYYSKTSKDPTYYIQHGYRIGKKATTRNVKRIGKHSELLKITDDPLAYAKKQVENFNLEYKEGKITLPVTVDFTQEISQTNNSPSSKSTSKNIGYFYLQKIYQDLKLDSFFNELCKDSKVKFNCNDINRFLTFGRILDPKSKLGTFDNLDSYYENPQFDYHQIFRFLDILADSDQKYLKHLYQNSTNVVSRNSKICYFDCTNYYFEVEDADEPYVDTTTGEIFPGLRRYGVSKEHRPNPIVQMGLFMDANGIPMSMCINPGNKNEQLCAVPAEKDLIKITEKASSFIYCADGGLSSKNIREFNNKRGRHFIVTQSLKGTKIGDSIRKAVFSDIDYRRFSNGESINLKTMQNLDKTSSDNALLYNDRVYKVISADCTVETGMYETKTLKNGKTKKVKAKGVLPTNIIVSFSPKYRDYQRHIRNEQIKRAKKLLENSSVDSSKKGYNDVKRFIKCTSKEKSSYELDTEKITEEEKYDGFYAIATNFKTKNHKDIQKIFKINSNRYKIEESFRILKTNFKARPVYHQLDKRIKAHFIVCYTALLIYRLMEVKIHQEISAHPRRYSDGEDLFYPTTNNIIETLRNMNVENFHDMFYKACYTNSKTLTSIENTFLLFLTKQYYEPKSLNRKLKKILK